MFRRKCNKNKFNKLQKRVLVRVNDIPVNQLQGVANDIVTVVLPPHENLLVAEEIDLDIVYEDEALV